MDSKNSILQTLRLLKPHIQEEYKVKTISLFGSFCRDEQTDVSDIDLLVDFTDDADLFDLTALGQFLEDKLQRKVDVVTRASLRPELRESVLGDLATL